MKRAMLLILCALLALGAGGCVSSIPEEKASGGATLAPVREAPAAALGDSQSARDDSTVLYLPDTSLTRLAAVVRTVTTEPGQSRQEAVVRALLSELAASGFDASALRLSPVSNPVEVTRDLVTVNLSGSARRLGVETLTALRLAIANTLTELPDTDYVNVLIDGRDAGLDVAMTLPTGLLSRYPSGDLSTYRSGVEAQRAAQDAEIQKTCALYFAVGGGETMLCETRGVALSERSIEGYAGALLAELAKGAAQLAGVLTLMPPSDYVERDPELFVPPGASARYVELFFRAEVDDFLALSGSTRGALCATLCYTLTSFIPGLDGVIVNIGGEAVTEMELPDGSAWSSPTGRMTREDFTVFAADLCTLYYPLADGSGLRAVPRAIAQRLRTQPRALLRALMETPEEAGLAAALPAGVTDADILGIQLRDDAALVNLSSAFAAACAGMDEAAERDMIYAMVNTLTELEGVRRVYFYVGGEQRNLAGHLYMGGAFLRHPGIIAE